MKPVLLVLLTACMIYFFSSQTYEQQSLIPLLQLMLPGEPLKGLLSQLELTYWSRLISVEERGYYYFLEFLIRKFAHLLLFGILAVSLTRFLETAVRLHFMKAAVIALLLTGLYAVFDEYHQLQTGGRTALVSDVLLDITGAVIAIWLYAPVHYMLRRRRKNGPVF
ncbi:VanZ family protein [Domibacillus antri]|uniref:VanZ family protein n=1 Tax=Domibacillus antri TaxID=1714264 RepID=A0A1Q8Q9W0_9BACI|nr:VanZ family protein [Domibacillus antri]OLN24091.1 VanZ family protein [Domibacillus antri]